jgi:putative oxidoreductase
LEYALYGSRENAAIIGTSLRTTAQAVVLSAHKNKIMKIAVIIVRFLMGLLFIFGAVVYFLNFFPQPELTGNLKTFNEGIAASGYFLPLLKFTELVCGIAFVAGRFVPLACVIIAPVIINILFVHIFLDRAGLPVAIFLVAANLFLAYAYGDKFKPLLEAK